MKRQEVPDVDVLMALESMENRTLKFPVTT